MPFTPVTYNTGAAPGLDGPAFNAMQTQFAAAINSFERDLYTPFVFSGLTATRDGVTLSQLNVTAGVAFLTQSGVNSELFRQAPTSSTQSTSGHPSTTMYLFLQPDGTWAWQTSSTPPTNALAIAHCTTDASSNILVVTDDRVVATSLLPGMAGTVAIPNAGKITFDLPLSAANQLMDWQQGFGIFSDNTGGVFSGGTTRIWMDAAGTNNTQEFHIGPRIGANRLRGFRVLANDVIFDGNVAGAFKIQGQMTFSADAGTITSNGSGTLSATQLKDGGNRVAVTGSGSTWATQAVIGIGDLAHRPAAGVKGRLYVETPFA